MTKKLLFLVAVSGLIFANNGCTSKKADDEQLSVENADIEKIEADGMGATAQVADSSLESALGDTPTTNAATPPEASAPAVPTPTPTETNSAGLTIDDSSLNLDTPEAAAASAPPIVDTAPPTVPVVDSVTPTITETPIPPAETGTVDTAALAASLGASGSATSTDKISAPTTLESAGTTTDVAAVSKPAASSVKKITDTMPYQGKNGSWINSVYIARPNEKLADISMKIFGADKSKDLKQIAENKYLKSRSVKAGDKIYYTSPNRPDDATKTMLYYEDMGMVPEIYVAKKGENLKKISKAVLGYDIAWKEVWASNGVESKTTLKEGETLRYWKSAETPTAEAGTAAANAATGTATLVDASQAPQATAKIEPPAALPPPPTDANANLPPPPTDAAATTAAAAPEQPTLPPPPPADLAPPPPPPPDVAAADNQPKKKINLDEAAAAEEGGSEMDSDMMMSMGALGVLVAMMAFVIIRKKKQKAQLMGEMNA